VQALISDCTTLCLGVNITSQWCMPEKKKKNAMQISCNKHFHSKSCNENRPTFTDSCYLERHSSIAQIRRWRVTCILQAKYLQRTWENISSTFLSCGHSHSFHLIVPQHCTQCSNHLRFCQLWYYWLCRRTRDDTEIDGSYTRRCNSTQTPANTQRHSTPGNQSANCH